MKQKMRSFLKAVAIVVVIMMTAATIQPWNAYAKTYRMKIQSGYPRGDLSMELLKVFADSAKKRSKGQLRISVFAEPEIVPGSQLFGATKQGVLDMVHAMGGFWAGIIPLGNVEFNLPLAFRIDEEATFEGKAAAIRKFIMESGYIDIIRKEYAKHGFHYLDIHTYGPVPFVLATKAVTNCNDLKGMKIKSDGINRRFHSSVGMSAVDISPTETYMSLKLGTVDAAEWDVSAVTGLKWHEVAPYWIRGMESDHTIGHILVSLKKWKTLPKEIKNALHGAAEEYWYATVNRYKEEVDAVETLMENGQVKESILSESCRAAYRQGADAVWKDLAREDAANAKLISLIRQWHKTK